VKITGLTKRFGDKTLYDRFSLTLPAGKISCLLGPSGCGKTSLLNMIAGLLPRDGGDILFEQIPPGEEPRFSYVFQEPRLLPWLTVSGNLVYAMDGKLSRHDRKARAKEMLAQVGLADEGRTFPRELSGGMARRVGLARALLSEWDILLMDEPLSSLDRELKERLIGLLRDRLAGRTVVFVTHDYYTARMLSDHIYLLTPPPVRGEEIEMARLESILSEINRREEGRVK